MSDYATLRDQVLGWDNPRWAVVKTRNRWWANRPGNLDNNDEVFDTFEEAIAYADKEARK